MEQREMIYHFHLASCRSPSDGETQRRRIAVDARDARMGLRLLAIDDDDVAIEQVASIIDINRAPL